MCVKLLYVKFVCVCDVRRREEEEKEPGIQNQKQEPTQSCGEKNMLHGTVYVQENQHLTAS